MLHMPSMDRSSESLLAEPYSQKIGMDADCIALSNSLHVLLRIAAA